MSSIPQKTPLKDCNAFSKKQKEKQFNINDPGMCTEEGTTDYVLDAIRTYQELDFHDEDLWEVFREDFTGWNKENIDTADRKAIRLLRDHLHENDVWVFKKQAAPIVKAQADVLLESKQHIWTEEQIEEQQQDLKPLNSRHGSKKPPTAGSVVSHEVIAQQLNTLPIMYPAMTEPLQRSPHHPMRTVIQPTSVFTPNMIKRHFQLRLKTILDTEIDQQ
ncbi:hypothetical protein GcC1_179012 [Golovinomyces cichoracearum]|uniref:Uncharacterized protein n=1 Tax=Golovinomyces cichoracearum TaxID=62708 RepID=A0A420HN53_9PEZI|nr:hypothetical protein GcC1_179012 [Golovinomyces cichoracearum]